MSAHTLLVVTFRTQAGIAFVRLGRKALRGIQVYRKHLAGMNRPFQYRLGAGSSGVDKHIRQS